MRQIILDTETTGLEPGQGHKIIEIGAIEMINRRMTDNTFHRYINPQREIEEAATEIHGIRNQYLKDKPVFNAIAVELLEFLKGAELIIHNAPFDLGFLNHEFKVFGLGDGVIEQHCQVLDTLIMARHKHPGQKNNLDALCRRYGVDNTQRTLHGALLDAEILADVYLQMTGGQTTLLGESEALITQSGAMQSSQRKAVKIDPQDVKKLTVTKANTEELEQHAKWLALLRKESKDDVVWDKVADSELKMME
ncbi:DNA polymerase III subunit epsilon [Candidatus Spongiihabitans sp.]|uniref:DNA polymerase III subunit epsilon n=1 Tax=Candidatus Spongiihabitans sp. TaxID=3101308 RepID=UPI003C6EFD0D